jgi:hypothetical protein
MLAAYTDYRKLRKKRHIYLISLWMISLLEKCSNLKEERQNKGHDDGNEQGKETKKGSLVN